MPAAPDFADLGVHECFQGGASLVEWSDRVEACLPADHLRITVTVTGETTRRVLIEAFVEGYAQIAEVVR